MEQRAYQVIGAPFELGSTEPGAGLAPDALRASGLTALLNSLERRGIRAQDLGDVAAPSRGDARSNPKNMAQLVEYSHELMQKLAGIYEAGACPIVLGGDHSISIPSVSAAASFARASGGGELGLIWVDAHPDLETPDTTPSGNLHGMPMAVLMGLGAPELVELGGFSPKVRPENVAFVGLSDVLQCERDLIESRGMIAYTATDIARFGIAEICDRVFGHMADSVSGFVLSFDVDSCDPSEVPGVEYPRGAA